MNIIKIVFLVRQKLNKKTNAHMQIPTTFSLQPRTDVCNTLNHMIYMQCDLVIIHRSSYV